MKKEKTLELLNTHLEEIHEIKNLTFSSLEYKKWHRNTRVVIQKVFGEDSPHVEEYDNVSFVSNIATMDPSSQRRIDKRAYSSGIVSITALVESMIIEVSHYEYGDHPDTSISEVESLKLIFSRFHLVARQLRSRYSDRETLSVEDEYDVQDLMHSLLTLFFDDIRNEEWTPSYAGSSSRVDFLLKQESIVIEIKKTRKSIGGKEIGEQLIVDIQRYQAHPDCKTLVCFVYDPEGRIANPQGLENDLNGQHNGLIVEVIIVPKFSS